MGPGRKGKTKEKISITKIKNQGAAKSRRIPLILKMLILLIYRIAYLCSGAQLLPGSLQGSAEGLCKLAVLGTLALAVAVLGYVFHHPLAKEAKGFEFFCTGILYVVVNVF